MKRTLILMACIFAVAATSFAGTSSAIFAFTPFGSQQLILNGTTVLDASSMGWYDETGFHDSANPNYIAGVCGSSDSCFGNDLNQHDFFVFNLANVQHLTITSAVLSIGNSPFGYINPNPTETYNVWDVSTSISDLISSQVGRLDIFNDLGSGSLYASQLVSAADDGTQVMITLDAAAIAAIQAAEGGNFAVGGAVNAAVPEPASMLLLGPGLAGLSAFARRRITK